MPDSVALFGTTLMSAIMMGLSCGTGCSPAISTFLSTYVIHERGNTRKTIRTFFHFFLGKACAVLLVCTAASLTGMAIVESNGYFGKYDIAFLMPLFLIISGCYLVKKCVSEWKRTDCNSCGGCRKSVHKIRAKTPFLGGFIYGLTPCAPLVMLAGYSVTMSAPYAVVLGTVFSASCSVSPLLLMLFFMNLIAGKMIEETPKLFQIIRMGMSIAVFAIGLVSLLNLYM